MPPQINQGASFIVSLLHNSTINTGLLRSMSGPVKTNITILVNAGRLLNAALL